ncbi:MAG: hypothetical protein ABI742_07410 [Gemmatimonadota bacterium]
MTASLLVNRAPVLTIWAMIVAERLGHSRATALTLGKALAGMNAQSKGRRLGIYDEATTKPGTSKVKKPAAPPPKSVSLLGRAIAVTKTASGLRAIAKDVPVTPASVERYLTQKFGAALPEVEAAMREVAESYSPKRLAEIGFTLYEKFRPEIPEGVKGWGAKGRLSLETIRAQAAAG